jgi:hypothetical protein
MANTAPRRNETKQELGEIWQTLMSLEDRLYNLANTLSVGHEDYWMYEMAANATEQAANIVDWLKDR